MGSESMKGARRAPESVSAGLIEVAAEYDGETWAARVDFADTYSHVGGCVTCHVRGVARDGEVPALAGEALEIAWLVPPGGHPVVDGSLTVAGAATLRQRTALLALSAVARRAALARLEMQAAA